jgi:hypothetical protein
MTKPSTRNQLTGPVRSITKRRGDKIVGPKAVRLGALADT